MPRDDAFRLAELEARRPRAPDEGSDQTVEYLENEKEKLQRRIDSARARAQTKDGVDTSYARHATYRQVLERRERAKRQGVTKRTRVLSTEGRLRKHRTATSFRVLRDTRYPSVVERTTKAKHEDAYSGFMDTKEWGPRGEVYVWHRFFAPKYGVPMTDLVES